MNAPEALSRLRKLGVPAATTADAAAVLGISVQAASHTMRRLARTGLVRPVRRGIWALGDRPDPLVLADYVTAPYPSYVSLQTALYRHGMIDQIPEMTFLVSLARSARVSTPLGTYSIHHVQPAFFGGFEMLPDSGIKIAISSGYFPDTERKTTVYRSFKINSEPQIQHDRFPKTSPEIEPRTITFSKGKVATWNSQPVRSR